MNKNTGLFEWKELTSHPKVVVILFTSSSLVSLEDNFRLFFDGILFLGGRCAGSVRELTGGWRFLFKLVELELFQINQWQINNWYQSVMYRVRLSMDGKLLVLVAVILELRRELRHSSSSLRRRLFLFSSTLPINRRKWYQTYFASVKATVTTFSSKQLLHRRGSNGSSRWLMGQAGRRQIRGSRAWKREWCGFWLANHWIHQIGDFADAIGCCWRRPVTNNQ